MNNSDNSNSNSNNVSLPPPPPLQSISPPPPPPPQPRIAAITQTHNPYLSLQSQLRTHFQWPTHNANGEAFTHICDQCGQGFITGQALGGHKGQHRKAKQRAIRQRIIQQNHKNNQYYYPNNHKNVAANQNVKAPINKPQKPHPIPIQPRPRPQPQPHASHKPAFQSLNSKRKRKHDSHNQIDANGNFPTHDADGIAYTHLCDTCGKGFSNGSALGGHRSVHKRMQRMGKIYNKFTGKHEYKAGHNPIPKKPNVHKKKIYKITQLPAQPRSFMRRPNTLQQQRPQRSVSYNNLPREKIVNEYSGLNNGEIMNKIMDKLEELDADKLFLQCDTSKEYKMQVNEVLSFQIIRGKISENKYVSVQQDFMADVNKLFRFVFQVYNSNDQRCKVALKLKQFAYKQTMAAMTPKVIQNNNNSIGNSSSSSLLSLRSPSPHNTAQQAQLYRLNCIQQSGYEKIDDYEFFCDDTVLTDKMKCNKRVSCSGNCCSSLTNLGPYCISSEKWQSSCECRSSQMECTSECKCDPLTCKNRNISALKYKKLNESIREQEVFGIDQHTRMMIEKILPKEIKEIYAAEKNFNVKNKDGKSYFIEDILCPAINNYLFFIADHALYASKYDPTLMIKSTQHEAQFMFSDVLRSMFYTAESEPKDANLCRIISYVLRMILNMGEDQLTNEISSIERSKRRISFSDENIGTAAYFLDAYLKSDLDVSGEDIICHEEFPIYTKGRGVICIDKLGILANEYVISFLGVVYSPWCWYEKDDRTRWLVKSRGAEKQPEFFNIMMEKHKDDVSGYDLVFIDPSKKGNYGSRLSHSCLPNCISVSMGVHDKYNIAVYASQNISYGEELCFNYNSVTENEQEWQDAVCLCGTSHCHGQFLIYAGTQLYTEVLKKSHHILHRTANLFNCNNNKNNENENNNNYVKILEKYNLKTNGALAGIPQWMRRYAALICQYIDYEQVELPKELQLKAANHEKGYDEFMKKEAAIEESKGLKYVRLSNLVITLNKMNLFFRHPPNRNLMSLSLFKMYENKDLIHKIWFTNHSIISDLYTFICIYEGNQHIILHKIIQYRQSLPQYYNSSYSICIAKSAEYLLDLRAELLKLPPRIGAYHHAASDILLFYASTKYFFYFYPPYQGFQSRVFTYAELGYESPIANQNSNYISYPPPKKYAQQYVWGQLNYWERHTIESPDSSLSADRRGTITLPNMKCCYVRPIPGKINKHRKEYNYNIRKQVIKHLKFTQHKPWPTKWHFAFKNGALYGSPWLDAYIDQQNEKDKFEKMIEIMKDTKMIYTDGTYIKIESDLESSADCTDIIMNDEYKTNSTNPNHFANASSNSNSNSNDEQKNENHNNDNDNKRRRSNRLRGKMPKRSYIEPKI